MSDCNQSTPRAHATFDWISPAGDRTEFSAILFVGDEWTVELRSDLFPGLIAGAVKWRNKDATIDGGGVFWNWRAQWTDAAKYSLLLAATNALRGQLGIEPIPAFGG